MKIGLTWVAVLIGEVFMFSLLQQVNGIEANHVMNETVKQKHTEYSSNSRVGEKENTWVSQLFDSFMKSHFNATKTKADNTELEHGVVTSMKNIRRHLIQGVFENSQVNPDEKDIFNIDFESLLPSFVNHNEVFEKMRKELKWELQSNITKCKLLKKKEFEAWIKRYIQNSTRPGSYNL